VFYIAFIFQNMVMVKDFDNRYIFLATDLLKTKTIYLKSNVMKMT